MGCCCSWCYPGKGPNQGLYNHPHRPITAAERVMETRSATKEETNSLLAGYEEIFPSERVARKGMDLDEVQKGGTTYSIQRAEKGYASQSSSNTVKMCMWIGLACFLVLGFVALCIFIAALFLPSFQLYSELVNDSSGWLWNILKHISPWLLVVLLIVFLLLMCCCVCAASMPSFATSCKPGDESFLKTSVRVATCGLCGVCFCGLCFMLLTILGFLTLWKGTPGAYSASNEICRTFEKGAIGGCPLVPVVGTTPTTPTTQQASCGTWPTSLAWGCNTAGSSFVQLANSAAVCSGDTTSCGGLATSGQSLCATMCKSRLGNTGNLCCWLSREGCYMKVGATPTQGSGQTPNGGSISNGYAMTCQAAAGGRRLEVLQDEVLPHLSLETAGGAAKREFLQASPDIDLDLVDLEEDGAHGGVMSSVVPQTRRLATNASAYRRLAAVVSTSPAHDKAMSFIKTKASTPTGCADTRKLCEKKSKSFSNTSCVCSGHVGQSSTANFGSYCKVWGTASPKASCYVNLAATAQCGAGSATPNLASTSKQVGSEGPCNGKVVSKYDTVWNGWWWFLAALIPAALLSLCCCCALCCGISALNNARKVTDRIGNKQGIKADGLSNKYRFKPEPDMAPATVTKVPLMPLEEEFRYYQEEASRKLTDATPDSKRYELYGFYHQAVQGNVTGERPQMFHPDDMMKFDAWNRLKGMSRNEAMRGYCNAVKVLPEV